MLCKENCICSLCRQLKSFSETKAETGDGLKVRNCRKLTFFGMELDLNQQEFEKFSTIGKKAKRKVKRLETGEKILKKTEQESRHKSVIYVNEAEKLPEQNIKRTEKIDSDFTLELLEHCQVLNVISQSTFSYACQLFDEVTIGSYRFFADDLEDDFPLGMEADMISQYLSHKR